MTELAHALLFGYGSLVLDDNRALQLGGHVAAMPVVAQGVERVWGFVSPDYGLTALTLRWNPQASCVGVLFPISAEGLAQMDVREQGYHRVELPRETLRPFDSDQPLPTGTVYTYVAQELGVPNEACPIVQSDLDVMLTGCLEEQGDTFARAFLRTTSGWEAPWLDDRAKPRYPYRPDTLWPAEEIDRLLAEELPEVFRARKTLLSGR